MNRSIVDVSFSSRTSSILPGSPSSTSTSSGFTFRFPSGLGGQHGSTNLVIYIVPILLALGLVSVIGWWLYLRRGRKARAKAFRQSLEIEARISASPPSITFLRPISSSCSLATVFEKSFETPPVFPPSRAQDELARPPPPVYSPGWSNVGPIR